MLMRGKLERPWWFRLLRNSFYCFIICIILGVLFAACFEAYNDFVYGPTYQQDQTYTNSTESKWILFYYLIGGLFVGYGICLIATSIFMVVFKVITETVKLSREHKRTRRLKRNIKAKTNDELVKMWAHQDGYIPEMIALINAEVAQRHIGITSTDPKQL
jgi:hypothetical protein